MAARRARWAMAATGVLQVLAIGLLLVAVARMAAVVRLVIESSAQVLSPFASLPAFALAIFSVAGAVAAVVLWAGVLIVTVALGWRAIGLLTACHIE